MKSWNREPDSTMVVVTGIGMVTAIAHNRENTWLQLLQGQSGIKFDTALQLPIARIENLDNSSQVSGPQSRAEYLLQTTVLEAIADAHLELPLSDCGIVIGSSRSNQRELELLLDQPQHLAIENYWLYCQSANLS